MLRRAFLKHTGLASASTSLLLNGLPTRALPQSRLARLMNLDNDKVLVLVQLQGGNDGLNTLIPMESYDRLAEVRSNILIPENQLLPLDEQGAFHPAFSGMKNLFEEGKLHILHSVGYPNQNRSHFRSTDIWTSGSAADVFDSTGWLGKYFDTQYNNYPEGFPNAETPDPIALSMSAITSETCQGLVSNYSLALTDPFSLSPLTQGQGSIAPDTPYGEELLFIRESISQTNAYTDVVTQAANQGSSLAEYPNENGLAEQLRNVAYLLSGGLQTKIFVCSIGGFDTHANQTEIGDSLAGRHTELLTNVSEAIEAFQTDLRLLGLEERVMGMTFSEFGRQIASNQSQGTDHGDSAPLFVFGSCVNPGFSGQHPEIAEELVPQEGVEMQIDFRDVYGSILKDWFEVEETEIKSLLYEDFTALPIVGTCTVATSHGTPIDPVKFTVFPNPVMDQASVEFESKGENIRLRICDIQGRELQSVSDSFVPPGTHLIPLEVSHLASGTYFLRLGTASQEKTIKLLKL